MDQTTGVQGASDGTSAGNAGGSPTPSDAGPILNAIQCVGPSLVDPQNNTLTFSVAFSVAVTDVVPADFAVTGVGGTVTAVSGSRRIRFRSRCPRGAAERSDWRWPIPVPPRSWIGTAIPW